MNDDFKRPLGPTSKVQEAEPVENEPPVNLASPNTLQKEKKKHSKAFSFVSILLLLALLGAGVMTYFWYDAQNKLDDANNRITTVISERDAINANSAKQLTEENEQPELSQKDNAGLVASTFACNLADFGCDKVLQEITKLKEHSVSSNEPGFAIVKLTNIAGISTNVYVKTIDGLSWTVIYDGQNTPPQEIVEKFEIPEDF